MEVTPIGVIHSPFSQATGTPVQPSFAGDAEGWIELFPPFAEGLRDVAGFQRIWLLFWCHRASAAKMTVVPYRDTVEHGLFATRSPARPNPIGMSSVRLIEVMGNIVKVAAIDILDGTPLLDIKPYVSQYDSFPDQRCGWLGENPSRFSNVTADGRFERSSADAAG